MQCQHRGDLSAVVSNVEAPAFSISIGTRARRLASRYLLPSSSPVDTQLSIQTLATSSYSSNRAGRIVGADVI